MKKIGNAARWRRTSAGLLVSLSLLAAGCDKTAPTEPAMFPTPVPTAAVSSLDGDWTGTMSGCGSITGAVIVQGGSTVRITFETTCYGRLTFNGNLSGDAVSGHLSKAGNVFCRSISGASSGTVTTAHIQLLTGFIAGSGSSPFGPCPGLPANTIDLRR